MPLSICNSFRPASQPVFQISSSDDARGFSSIVICRTVTKRTAYPVFFYAQDGSPGDNKLKLSHLSTWVFCQWVVSSQCPTAYPTLDDILFTCQPKNCILWDLLWDLGKLQQLETMYSTALSQDLLHTWTTHRKRKFLAQALRPPWILQGATTRSQPGKIQICTATHGSSRRWCLMSK